MTGSVSAVALLARRFLLSKSSDGFLSFIAWVSIVGVALGVLALVVVTSVINGFEGELVRVITGMHGDLILYTRADPISEPAVVAEKVRRTVPAVTNMTQSFITELMASGPNGVAGAALEGVDFTTVNSVTELTSRVVSGRLPTQGDYGDDVGLAEVALGSALAERIGAKEGTEVRLILPYTGEASQEPRAEPDEDAPVEVASGAPKTVKAKVVGVVRMGMYEYDSKYVFTTLPLVQRWMGRPGQITMFKMKLGKGFNSQTASELLSDAFGYPFRAKDWAQMNRNLFYAIRLEKVVIAIILAVIVIVAAFNVVSTLMMMIHDKTKEISILKAMGFRPAQGFRLFCAIGVGMGAIGTVFGVGLGLLLNRLIVQSNLISLPADIYYISFLPVVVRWKEVGMIAICALLISFAATIYPSWKVARRSPLDGLRYE